jgi:hypothetical protein
MILKWTDVALDALDQLGDATEARWREAFARAVGAALSVSSIRTTFGRTVDELLRKGYVRVYAGSHGDRLMRIVSEFDLESKSIASVLKRIETLESTQADTDAELLQVRATLADILKGE